MHEFINKREASEKTEKISRKFTFRVSGPTFRIPGPTCEMNPKSRVSGPTFMILGFRSMRWVPGLGSRVPLKVPCSGPTFHICLINIQKIIIKVRNHHIFSIKIQTICMDGQSLKNYL